MYARATLLEIDTVRSDRDTAVAAFRAEVLPAVQAQPGYRGVLVLSTPEGKGLIVSLWDTAAAADASGGFYAETIERFVTLFRSPPGRERYEVTLMDLPARSSR
jgi:hypothetical protein